MCRYGFETIIFFVCLYYPRIDVTISFTNHIYSGNEGDSNFRDVCVQVLPQVSFETDLTVSVTVSDDSAGMYYIQYMCHEILSIAISQTLQTTYYLYHQSSLLVPLQNALHLN